MTFFIDDQDARNQIVKELLTKDLHAVQDVKHLKNATKEDIVIFAPNKKFDDTFLRNLPSKTTLVCGNIPTAQKKIIAEKQIKHINVLQDEVFAIKNSCLTAEGILGIIIEKTPVSIFDQNYLILGNGRVGKATSALFAKLGLRHSVSSYDKQNFALAHIYAKHNFLGKETLNHLSMFDVIINTIPAQTIPNQYISNIKTGCLFLEIASMESIDSTLAKHFSYITCPALPQKYSAFTAGKYFYDSIMKTI